MRDTWFAGIQFDDETLRDGLQSPSAMDPSLVASTAMIGPRCYPAGSRM